MSTEEAIRVLKEFAASFAGASYEDVCEYESKEVLREATAESGTVYTLFLASSLVEVVDAKRGMGRWGCCVSVSVTPARGARKSRKSIGGNKMIMPGETWKGDLENVGVSEPPSMAGCYAAIVAVGLAVFAVAFWIRSCTLAR